MKLRNVFISMDMSIHAYVNMHGEKPDKMFVSTALSGFIKRENALLPSCSNADAPIETCLGISVQEYNSDEMSYYLAEKGILTDYPTA